MWVDFKKLYIKKSDGKWFKINLSWGNRINFDMRQDHRTDADKMPLHSRLKNHFNIYSSFASRGTFLFISHRNYISIYDF